MNCAECRGACCEEMALREVDVRIHADALRWLRLHSDPAANTRGWLTFEVRCGALSQDGRCNVYEDRPAMCRYYPAGGQDCLDTVKRRRTADDYRRIRGPEDPARIHDQEAAA